MEFPRTCNTRYRRLGLCSWHLEYYHIRFQQFEIPLKMKINLFEILKLNTLTSKRLTDGGRATTTQTPTAASSKILNMLTKEIFSHTEVLDTEEWVL